MTNLISSEQQLTKYDRLRGGLHDVALFTKPSTVKHVQGITGKSETFVIETARYEDMGGDYIFVECMDESGVIRLALPPKVANIIASQRDSLTARRRSLASKRIAQERKERGELPGFMRNKPESPVTKKGPAAAGNPIQL
jgi:hypothetical protein